MPNSVNIHACIHKYLDIHLHTTTGKQTHKHMYKHDTLYTDSKQHHMITTNKQHDIAYPAAYPLTYIHTVPIYLHCLTLPYIAMHEN